MKRLRIKWEFERQAGGEVELAGRYLPRKLKIEREVERRAGGEVELAGKYLPLKRTARRGSAHSGEPPSLRAPQRHQLVLPVNSWLVLNLLRHPPRPTSTSHATVNPCPSISNSTLSTSQSTTTSMVIVIVMLRSTFLILSHSGSVQGSLKRNSTTTLWSRESRVVDVLSPIFVHSA